MLLFLLFVRSTLSDVTFWLCLVYLCTVYTVSQKTSHLWLAITLTHMNECARKSTSLRYWYFWQNCYR